MQTKPIGAVPKLRKLYIALRMGRLEITLETTTNQKGWEVESQT